MRLSASHKISITYALRIMKLERYAVVGSQKRVDVARDKAGRVLDNMMEDILCNNIDRTEALASRDEVVSIL